MSKKELLRKFAKNYRLQKDFTDISQSVTINLKKITVFNSSQNVMIFHPLHQEIDVLQILDNKKNYSYPRIINNEIVPFLAGKEFKKGAFGIQEPLNTPEQKRDEIDIVIVPCLCADLNGYRLGYGKGYYDRFLRTLNRNKTKIITVVCDDLIVPDIEPDVFDEKVDFIVSEKRIIKI